MTIEAYIAFVAASALLILTPGPMVAYVIGATLSRGLRHGLFAVAGSMLASAIQLACVAAGLAFLLQAAGDWFFWLKWVGAAYLIYLGVKALQAPPPDTPPAGDTPLSAGRTFWEAFAVNMTNPKGLLFHGAFLPLFISPAAPAGPQLLLLSVTFLVIGGGLDSMWALTAARSRGVLARLGQWKNRITGGVLLTAAAGLAFARK